MIRDRGYTGSITQLRRAVSALRPMNREPFLKLTTFAGEHYGEFRVMVRTASAVTHTHRQRASFAALSFP
jgi:hypothetical protein